MKIILSIGIVKIRWVEDSHLVKIFLNMQKPPANHLDMMIWFHSDV